MTIALKQLTDAQLTDLGWTAGQIKEVRKYHKAPTHLRNAHQRALCRRYSDAQREVFTVKSDVRFTNDKKAKKNSQRGPRTRWTADILDFVIDQFTKHVDTANGVENRAQYVKEIMEAFPQVNQNAIPMVIAQIKKMETAQHLEGLDGSALLHERLAAYNERVGYSRFAV